MPSPSKVLTRTRPDLASGMLAFDLAMNQRGFIASRVLPPINVQQTSGVFGKVDIAQLLSAGDTDIRRAPRSGYKRGNWTFTDDFWKTQEHGWEEPVDEHDLAVYGDWFRLEQISTERARNIVLQSYEQRVAEALFDASTFTGAMTSNANIPWSNPESTPVDDIEEAITAMRALGITPNKLILSWTEYRHLRRNQQIIDMIQAQGAGMAAKPRDLNPAMLASVFDLEEVLVGGALFNTAAEGQTADLGDIWSPNYAMLAKITDGDDLEEPGLGRTFHYTEDGSELAGHVEEYEEPQTRTQIIRVRNETDEKIIHPHAGHLIVIEEE